MKKEIFTFALGVVVGIAGSCFYNKREKLKDYVQSLMNKGEAEEIPSDPKGQNAAE